MRCPSLLLRATTHPLRLGLNNLEQAKKRVLLVEALVQQAGLGGDRYMVKEGPCSDLVPFLFRHKKNVERRIREFKLLIPVGE